MTDEVRRLLSSALGDQVSVLPADLDAARADRSGFRTAGDPIAIVEPVDVEGVRTVMRIATATHTPVVTRGAGTGLAGGAAAGTGEIVLSTRRLDDLIQLSVEDRYAVVGAGMLNGDLNDLLHAHGLWYAPDPASRAISTIGGNIATNAGGLLCAKYGVTREAVLGLTVVRADGSVLQLGRKTVKGVTGLDLTALMIGSEGTLAVVVSATLRVRPIVAGSVTLSAGFPTVDAAARACAAVTASGLQPAALELLDEAAVEVISMYLGWGQAPGARVIVRTDGPAAATDADAIRVILSDAGGTCELSRDAEEGERLFAFRRAFHPAMESRGSVLIEDVCVPRSELPAMFREIRFIERAHGIRIPTVAHAGDGNLHPNFVYDGPTVPDSIWRAADELFRAALSLGGTLTGEHGIGVLKRRWLADELGEDQVRLQREIKAVFDPLGILNPRAVFESHI